MCRGGFKTGTGSRRAETIPANVATSRVPVPVLKCALVAGAHEAIRFAENRLRHPEGRAQLLLSRFGHSTSPMKAAGHHQIRNACFSRHEAGLTPKMTTTRQTRSISAVGFCKIVRNHPVPPGDNTRRRRAACRITAGTTRPSGTWAYRVNLPGVQSRLCRNTLIRTIGSEFRLPWGMMSCCQRQRGHPKSIDIWR